MTTTTNEFFQILEINSPEEFRDYCTTHADAPYVQEIFGQGIPELYEQAEEALTLYIQGDGFPRNRSRQMAQQLLFRMAEARVDGARVGIASVLSVAGRKPHDFMFETALSVKEGSITLTPLEE